MEKIVFAPELQTEENKALFVYIAELEAENEVVNEVNKELSGKIEELSAKASLGEAGEKAQAEEKPTLPTEPFTVDGNKYKFIAPVFVYGGKKVLASQAINDTALLSELVAKGIGVITKA
jgi:hypothetical protein